jgi:dihydroorotate dehydrogenase (NAD+) catalytic subunit
MVNLSVKIGKLKLKNPVMAASGTFGMEYRHLIDVGSLGAIVTKTITLKARTGNPPPRIAETPSGMLNSIGLENKGLEDFIRNRAPLFPAGKSALVVSIAGDTEDEFTVLVKRLNKVRKVDAIELNLSCPNVRHGTREALTAQDERGVYEVIDNVRGITDITLIAKLSPCVTDIAKIAKAAEEAGADAVSLINTFPAMAVDIETKKALLGNVTGGLSGPAIKPIALKMVRDTYKKIGIPIIGIGGIMDYRGAVEFILCGATAVQIGTANFVNPKACPEIIKGIRKYLESNKISDINRLVGGLEE